MASDSPSQFLTSYTGGSNMLVATTNDSSYWSFAAAADSTHNFHTSPGSTSLSRIPRSSVSSALSNSFDMNNNVRSPQPAFYSSFHVLPGWVDSCSDWSQQQPRAANNDGPAFSSSLQGSSLGRSHRPRQLELDVRKPARDGLPQGHEHERQEPQRIFSYLEAKHASLYPGVSIPKPMSRSSPSFVVDGLSSIPDPQSSFSPRRQQYSVSQSSPGAYSCHSSQDGASSVTVSNPLDRKDAVSDISMLNNPDYAQGGLSGNPNHLTHDVTTQTGIQAIGSAAFSLQPGVWQLSSSVEPSTGYPSSETNSTTPSQGKGKDLRPRAASIAHSDSYFIPLGSPGTQPQDRPQSIGLFGRRLSTGQAHIPILPRPRTQGGIDKGGISKSYGKTLPKKPRGKRMGPLREGKRQLATKRRNERTVCIGCKMAKVMCDGREEGRDCSRCTSSHSNAPKPFVCASASFCELVQQGSTVLLALYTIYPIASDGFRLQVDLPSEINIKHILHFMDELQKNYDAFRVYGRHGLLYELDLHACWVYINSTCSPVAHPFQQFINGLKVQRQDTWKSCIRDGHSRPLNKQSLCDVLLAMDDMAPWATYVLKPKPSDFHGRESNEFETALVPDHDLDRQIIIIAAQLSRILGRKLELQFYDHLKKALANPCICRELVLEVGRTLMSLRRRLTQWTCHTYQWTGSSLPTVPESAPRVGQDDKGDNLFSSSVSRLKNLCQVLYVYFCYMRRRLSPNEQEGIRTMMVLYPDSEVEVEESFPQYESIDGFEEWLHFKDQPVSKTEIESDRM